ncbi:MAG: hypothetical protein U0R51_08190 [Solirubrobacterales bacterium]
MATVLLASATLATAWAGYQATRWHSEQAKNQAKATATRIESTRSADAANREAQVDLALFIQWVDSRAQGDLELAAFYRQRFTDRFQPAFEAWIATKPFDNPDAPTSPFVMRGYQTELLADADAEEAQANSYAAAAGEDIDRADKYVFAVVLFATCLFFAGLSTRLRTRSGQTAILALGCVLFVASVCWLVTFPVSVNL